MLSLALALLIGTGDELKFDVLEVIEPYEFSFASFVKCLDLGDLNADGYSEFAIHQAGQNLWNPHPARVYVINGFDRRVLSRFVPDPSRTARDTIGVSLAMGTLGGSRRLLISDPGAPQNGIDWSGEVLVCDPLKGTVVATVPGDEGSRFGWHMASGFDLDGDGYDEILVGADTHPWHGWYNVGVVALFDGATLQERFRIYGSRSGEFFSGPLDFLDDLDGDGVHELLMASPFYAGKAGRVLIVSGATGQVIWSGRGKNRGDGYGRFARRLPDLDGDGIAEFGWFTEGQRTLLIYGGIPGQPLLQVDLSGEIWPILAFDGISDRTGDGVPDLIVSGFRPPPGGWPPKVLILSGATGEVVHTFEDPPDFPDEWFGYSLDEVADVTGDGQPDLLILSAQTGCCDFHGLVRIYQTRSLFRQRSPVYAASSRTSTWALRLKAPAHAGEAFALLFSTSAREGLALGTRTIPLDLTPLLSFSAQQPVLGHLDASGEAVVPVVLPSGNLLPSDARVRACWLGLDADSPLGVRVISNALNIPVH